jgi:hypothetical protein
MNHENLIKFQLLLWSEESSLLLRSADTPYKTPSASNNSVYSLSNSPEMVQLGRNGLVARYRRIFGLDGSDYGAKGGTITTHTRRHKVHSGDGKLDIRPAIGR